MESHSLEGRFIVGQARSLGCFPFYICGGSPLEIDIIERDNFARSGFIGAT
jgi:hypothetical protein